MNASRMFGVLCTFAVTLLFVPESVRATDVKTYHASACSAAEPATDDVRIGSNLAVNNFDDVSAKWIYCPVVRDSIAADDVFTEMDVYVYDGNDAASVSVYGYTMDKYGGLSSSTGVHTGSAYVGYSEVSVTPPSVGFGDDTTYLIRVSIPRADTISGFTSRSRVYGYFVRESQL